MDVEPDRDGSQAASVRTHARDRLAHEVHDELTHAVARVCLQVVGHRPSDDVDELRWALDSIGTTGGDIQAHLRLLDRVLRAETSTTDSDRAADACAGSAYVVATRRPEQLACLALCDPVVEVVHNEAERLRAAGFTMSVRVPGEIEETGQLTRRTVEEAVTMTGDVIRRHGEAGSRCELQCTTSSSTLLLRITAMMPAGHDEVVDRELLALHERTRLLGGTLWTGRPDPSEAETWSLVLRWRPDMRCLDSG